MAIFITGFVSVRLHAHRDRAFVRADVIESAIRQAVEEDTPGTDRELLELAQEHAGTLAKRSSAMDAIIVNGIVFILVLVLEAMVVWKGDWKFTLRPPEISSASIGLGAILVVQAAVILVSWLDLKRINQDMNSRRKATLWGKVATARYLIDSRPMLSDAARLANEVFQEAAKTAWPLRLRARVHLAIAEDADQGYAAAIDAAGDALSELGKAIEVKNYDGSPTIDELTLRSRVYEFIGDLDSSIADIDLALVYDDRDSELRVRRGQLLQRLGAYDDARDEYNRAKAQDILSTSPLIARAELEDSVGATEDAFVLFEEALQIDPHSYDIQKRWWEVMLSLAAKELERGHPEAVVALLDEALQRSLGGQQVPRRRIRSLMARVGLMRRTEAHADSRAEAERLRRRAAFEVMTSQPP